MSSRTLSLTLAAWQKPHFFKNLKPSSPPLPAEHLPKSHTHVSVWKLESDCEQAPGKETLHLINETLIAKPQSGSWFPCPPLRACNRAVRCALLHLTASIPCVASSPPSMEGGRRGRPDWCPQHGSASAAGSRLQAHAPCTPCTALTQHQPHGRQTSRGSQPSHGVPSGGQGELELHPHQGGRGAGGEERGREAVQRQL